jgi:transposase
MVENLSYNGLLKENRVLKDQIKVLKQKLSDVEKENQELRGQLNNLNTEFRDVKEEIKRTKFKPNNKGRSKGLGRKPGFKGVSRKLPVEIHEEIDLKLEKCPECNKPLKGKVLEVRERVVEGIKPPKAYNKKYNIHRKWCVNCKKMVEPKPKDVLPNCRFSIPLMIFITYLKYGMRMPFNKISELLDKFYGIKASEGGLANSIQIMSDYFGPLYDQLKRDVKKAVKIGGDETGWRIDGKNHWLWIFISEKVVLFTIEKSRGGKVVKKTLGKNFKGILNSDFWSAYAILDCKKQKCLEHLKRDLKKLGRKTNVTEEEMAFCKKLKRIVFDAIRLKEKVKDLIVIRWRKGLLLHRTINLATKTYESKDCRRLSERLIRHKDELFTFLEHNVNWHNNDSERPLRNSVIIRKISGGNRSKIGAKAYQVLMSIIETDNLQGVNFISHAMSYLQESYQKAK